MVESPLKASALRFLGGEAPLGGAVKQTSGVLGTYVRCSFYSYCIGTNSAIHNLMPCSAYLRTCP